MLVEDSDLTKWLGYNHPLFEELRAETVFNGNPDLIKFHRTLRQLTKAYLNDGWDKLGAGRHRVVFASPNGKLVAKVSRTLGGVQANLYEWLTTMNGELVADNGVVVPRTFQHTALLGGVSILFVEFVERLNAYNEDGSCNPLWDEIMVASEDWLDWVDSDGEGYQIGTTLDGRVVAFDWCPF